MAPPKKSDKVWKLVPLKVLYEELRPFRCELSELRFNFLLWNWNCISVSICKEIMDKNETEGEDLGDNPMLWTIEIWAKATLEFREARDEWMEDRRLPGSEETGDCTGDYAYLATGAHDLSQVKEPKTITVDFRGRSAKSGEAKTAIGEEKKSVAPSVSTPEVAVGESTQPMKIEGPSGVLTEVSGDVPVEPLKEGTEMVVAQVGGFATEISGHEEREKMTTDLLTRFEKSREAYDEAVKRSERLNTTAEKQEKKHVEELAKLEARRAEEVRITKELRGKIAEAKTAEEDLRSKIAEIAGKCEMEFRRVEELSTSLAEGVRKHEEELANWPRNWQIANRQSLRRSNVN
ncbi:hypothetical protein AXG93_4620s2200 [Marchantia polymorpha subsp. ruderalis]|uniref:Uncharacterized protein n=1 Tax=Marchantia polymorpha subsp. ruderalis TaxID=1480154 RepID=A0A176VYW8_MARPO|nr:hypothetical protein AXG93_4620s2200 [Marchantia polymorpha subsp. ruderalis]